MEKKVVFLTTLMIVLLLASLPLPAASKNGIVVSQNGRQMIATQTPSQVIPAIEDDAKLATISGNLSTYKYGTFFCCFGWTIAGPNSELGLGQYIAVPFTPSKTMHVNKVEAAVGYYTANVPVTLSVNEDSNGLPGNPIKSWNAKVPYPYGECCTLVSASSKAGVPVTGGTQYWLVVGASTDNSDFYGGWADNTTDMRLHVLASVCIGTACGSGNGKWEVGDDVLPAYAVLGK